MSTWLAGVCSLRSRFTMAGAAGAALLLLNGTAARAQSAPDTAGGEAGLKLPDLSQVSFLGMDGHKLLTIGILFCVFGLIFGMVIFNRLKNLPVHRSMREVSELIYETCKTYLITQGKFLLFLWLFIAVIIVLYFGVLSPVPDKPISTTLPIILLFSLIGIGGSYGVAWFGIRVNTFANSRTAFAGLRGKPYPIYQIPLEAGMSIGMMLISVELLMMLFILLFIPGDYAGPCFIGFAIGESLGAAALRIAGGIFTKIADIGSDLMKIVFKIKEDDARNPGVIADCTGRQRRRLGWTKRRRFRDLRRHRRRADYFHPAGRPEPHRAGPATRLDFRNAYRDAGGQRRCLFHQRRGRQGALRRR